MIRNGPQVNISAIVRRITTLFAFFFSNFAIYKDILLAKIYQYGKLNCMNLPYSEYLQIALFLLSAIILFLFAIESLGKEFLNLATESFRKVVSKLAKNRFLGAIIGAFSTAIVQSSTAITTVTITLVNTGIISFHDSLAIMFGSSIGTTLTAQLALLSSTPIAPILIILGFLLKFGPKKLRGASNPIFFMGFILFSLNLLSMAITPLKSSPEFLEVFASLSSPIVAYFIACIITVLFHSSTITSGIVVVLAAQGVLPVEIAVPMILGANLGTAVSTLIVTTDLNLFAKRAGYANVFFKAIGSLLFMIFVNQFISLLQLITDNVGQQAALGHLIFNSLNTVLFLILLDPFEKFILRIVPGNEEEVLFETKYIDENSKNLQDSFEDIKKEITHSIDNTIRVFQKALTIYYNPTQKTVMEIRKFETLNDFLDDEVTKALLSTTENRLSKKMAKASIMYMKISNTIEQLGDLGIDFGEAFTRMHKLGVSPDEIPINKLTEVFNLLVDLFKSIEAQVLNPKEKELQGVKEKEEQIYGIINDEFNIHVRRLQESQDYHGNIFVDAISIVELSVSKLREIRKLLLKFVREFD